MKTFFPYAVTAACLTFVDSAAAQNYSIDWFTPDSGSTSTGGPYSVSGAAGQADANLQPMTGGTFSLDGGFWSLFAVQPPGGLLLTMQPVGPDRTTLSWYPNTPGLVLQESVSLSPASWRNSPSGSTNPIVIPFDVRRKLYRVFRP